MFPARIVGTFAALQWVLLQPPASSNGQANLEAPLGDWVSNGRFETSEACEKKRRTDLAAVAYGVSEGGGGVVPDIISRARCYSVETLKQLLGPQSTPEL